MRQTRRVCAFVGPAFASARHHVAGLDEGLVAAAALRHQVAGVEAELVDIELVVGEKDEVLEMLRACRRVVGEPVQRIVGALRRERGQRRRFPRRRLVGAVGDQVVGGVEVRHVEHVADRPLQDVGDRAVDMRPLEEGEVERDRRFGLAHRHRHAVVAHDETELFGQVGPEQVGPRDRRRIVAGRIHVAVGVARVDLREGWRQDTDLGIVGAVALVLGSARKRAERVAQERRIPLIEKRELFHRLFGIGEALPGYRLGGDDRLDRLGINSLFHAPL